MIHLIEKWAKNLNRDLTKTQRRQISTSHYHQGSTDYSSKEIPPHTHSNGQNPQHKTTLNAGEDVEEWKFYFVAGGAQNGTATLVASYKTCCYCRIQLSHSLVFIQRRWKHSMTLTPVHGCSRRLWQQPKLRQLRVPSTSDSNCDTRR